MNVANVIPLSAPHAVPYAKSGDPAVLNPVRVRFARFELLAVDEQRVRTRERVAVLVEVAEQLAVDVVFDFRHTRGPMNLS